MQSNAQMPHTALLVYGCLLDMPAVLPKTESGIARGLFLQARWGRTCCRCAGIHVLLSLSRAHHTHPHTLTRTDGRWAHGKTLLRTLQNP